MHGKSTAEIGLPLSKAITTFKQQSAVAVLLARGAVTGNGARFVSQTGLKRWLLTEGRAAVAQAAHIARCDF